MNIDIINDLARPFDEHQVRTRPGPGGMELSYVTAASVITRLNQALEGKWSFAIVEREVTDDEVIVVGTLTVHTDPPVSKTDVGVAQIRRNGDSASIGDLLKMATSDCLKRASRQLSVAISLYEDDKPTDDDCRRRDSGRGNGNGTHRGQRISSAQMGKLRELVDTVRGGDWSAFRDDVRELHGVEVAYLSRSAASALIGQLIDETRGQRGRRGAA